MESSRSLGTHEEQALTCRPVRAHIDLTAIAHNTRAVKQLVGETCRVMAVVKANGYGLGAIQVAKAALEGGATALATATVEEAIVLRRAGVSVPILVLSYVPPEEAEAVVRNDLSVVVHREQTAAALNRAANTLGRSDKSVAVHLKVDTGLGRFGCSPEEALPLLHALSELKHIRLEGLMTHFAEADARDTSFARVQLQVFRQLQLRAMEAGFTFEIVHAANTAAAIAIPESRLDMVRVGIVLSGNLPAQHLRGALDLRSAFSLRGVLARIFTAEEGNSVGYGRTWAANRPTRVGLVPVGYADGYIRALSNRGEVLVGGRRCPVAGRISMDQTGIDLTNAPDAAEGDEVVFIGRQGDEEVTVDEVAQRAGTISYELLCGITERVPRWYYRNGELVEVYGLLGCVTVGTNAGNAAREQGNRI